MQDSWPLLVLLLLIAAIVIFVQSWRLGRQGDIVRTSGAAAAREESRQDAAYARRLRAADGEHGAFALLERAGYGVLERQVPGSWTVHADGEPVTFGLRADYLVARAGRRYIAEVKTGRLAPRLSHGPTRRQLLEYSAAFDVHGVILVDADAQTITHVEMASARSAAVERGGMTLRAVLVVILFSFALGIAVGTAMAAVGVSHFMRLGTLGLGDPAPIGALRFAQGMGGARAGASYSSLCLSKYVFPAERATSSPKRTSSIGADFDPEAQRARVPTSSKCFQIASPELGSISA